MSLSFKRGYGDILFFAIEKKLQLVEAINAKSVKCMLQTLSMAD